MNILNNATGLLMPVKEVAKVLGVPKKAVMGMVSSGSLTAVDAGVTTYITKESLAGILGRKAIVDFGQQNNGYPEPEDRRPH